MEKFSKKINKKSTDIIFYSDIQSIKKYQTSLIDYMLYKTTRADDSKRNKLLYEIRGCEIWMKEQSKILVNDRNRKLDEK